MEKYDIFPLNSKMKGGSQTGNLNSFRQFISLLINNYKGSLLAKGLTTEKSNILG